MAHTTKSATEYGWQHEGAVHTHSYLLPGVLKALKARGIASGRLLDIGCGNGALTDRLREHGYTVVGLDSDEEGVTIAKKSFPETEFHQASAYDDLAGPFGTFDAVISCEVIEHLFTPNLFLARARAVLRPGGALVMTTPFHGYVKNLLLALTGKWDGHHQTLVEGGHIRFYSPATMTTLLLAQGFSGVEIGSVGRMPLVAKSMVVTANPAGQDAQ